MHRKCLRLLVVLAIFLTGNSDFKSIQRYSALFDLCIYEALNIVGAIAVVFGVLIIVDAVLLYQSGRENTGAIIVLLFSLLSILTFSLLFTCKMVFNGQI